MALFCATCAHWTPSTERDSAYAAPCALLVYPGRVTFDQSCAQHSASAVASVAGSSMLTLGAAHGVPGWVGPFLTLVKP